MTVNIRVEKTLKNGMWLFEAFRHKESLVSSEGKNANTVSKELMSLLGRQFPNDVIIFDI